MLEFLATDIYEGEINLPAPLSVTINQDVDVPADDMSVTFPFIEGLAELKYISVKENNIVLFSGVVDEQQILSDGSKAVIKIVARSMAALLLDNESKPVNYTNPSTTVMYEKHLRPSGIEKFSGEEKVHKGFLNVVKGTTHWQALKSFCSDVYGKIPRVEADGTVNFQGIHQGKILHFSNEDGIGYNSLKENIKRHSPVSEIYIKTSENQDYDVEISSAEAVKRGIKKVRYVDITNGVSTVETARKIIENSMKNSCEIILECPCRLLDILGAKASVSDTFAGNRDRLWVCSVQYRLTSSGEYTKIKLRKEC